MKIAYQGIKGSYSYQAIAHLKGEPVGLPTFREVYQAVERGDADLGLLPIENALTGTIHETLDLLNEGKLKIVGEISIPIEHCLMALPGAHIQTILSHPQALAQCKKLFDQHPEWEVVPHYDTAGAALTVAQSGNFTLGAIASYSAAISYDLEILEIGVQDRAENYTRFFFIAKGEDL